MKKLAKKYFVIEWSYIPLNKAENPTRDTVKAESEMHIRSNYEYFRVLGVYNSFSEVPANIYSL